MCVTGSGGPRSGIVDSPALLFALAPICSRRFVRIVTRSEGARSGIVDSPVLLFVLAPVCSRRFARVCNRKLAYAETKYIIPSPTDPEL